jgi:prephenate dehydratase
LIVKFKRRREMARITFLGPFGATFSHHAYNVLAEKFGAPQATVENYVFTTSNGDVLKNILENGGYGAVAMDTLAGGRVVEPLESFVGLLGSCGDTEMCPIRVVSAIRMKVHFCLMARKGVARSMITKVIAHPKALEACKRGVAAMGLATCGAASNGEAAQRVAESRECARYAALAPRSAADVFGLTVLDESFEDDTAFTTFFLIAPPTHPIQLGEANRVLIVYKIPHAPGALLKSLQPFRGLNLVQIHSVHAGNRTYDFAIEIDLKRGELESLERAMVEFKSCVSAHLTFGPFVVLSDE